MMSSAVSPEKEKGLVWCVDFSFIFLFFANVPQAV